MDILPTIWSIKATNQLEARIIADYVDPLNRKYNGNRWNYSDSFKYYITICNGKYLGGTPSVPSHSTKISFEEFEHLVLNISSTNTNYEIY